MANHNDNPQDRDPFDDIVQREADTSPLSQPSNRQSQPMIAGTQHAQPESGYEGDPMLTHTIPGPTTGEQRYVRDERGTPGLPAAPGGMHRMGGGGMSGPGIAVGVRPNGSRSGDAARVRPRLRNAGFPEQDVTTPTTADDARRETRAFSSRGADTGIEQQEILQRQKDERKGQRSKRGILDTVGDMLGSFFGTSKRTPHDVGEDGGQVSP